ncbi:trypsin-like serine protease [Curtobacterium poinsettiae]
MPATSPQAFYAGNLRSWQMRSQGNGVLMGIRSSRNHPTAIVAIVAMIVAFAAPAVISESADAADSLARNSLPVRAGTQLVFAGTRSGPHFSPDAVCTAGPVVRSTGIFARLSQYARAVRYVVTAGHCASETGQTVRVGTVSVGAVTWISGRYDLALVRIEPLSSRHQQCHSTSGGFVRCHIVVDWQPRASGQVILIRNRAGHEQSVAVQGTGTPAPREIYCVSGRSSGVICSFRSVPKPPDLEPGAGQAFSETFGANTSDGDSGGPVVSQSGRIYGVHVQGGDPESRFPTIEAYIPIGLFFREQPAYEVVRD